MEIGFRGHIVLFAVLAVALVWIFSSAPSAEGLTLSANTTTASVNKGSDKFFEITGRGCCYSSGTTFNIYVISMTPSSLPYQFSISSPVLNSSTILKVSPSSTAQSGTYTIIIRGNFSSPPGNNANNTITLTLNVGDFSIIALSSTATVRQGSSTTLAVNVTSISNFAGPVSLSIISLPSGVTASFNPSQVNVPSQGWVISTLTLQASFSAPTGAFTSNIIGTSSGGSLSRSIPVSIVVQSIPALAVTITANPSPAVVSKISTITVRVTSDGAPIQDALLTLSTTGGTLGATAGSTDASGQFLTTFNSTVPGQVTISATASKTNYVTGSVSFSLTVAGNFQISVSPADTIMTLGSTRAFQITVQSLEGFSSPVVLSIAPSISGMTATITPQVVTPPPNGVVTATLSITVNLTTTPGAIDLTITGTRNPLVKTASLRLNIPVRDFDIVVIPPSLTIAQGQQGFFNLSVTSRGGFTGFMDIRAVGIPDDVEFTLVPNSINLEAGATRTILLSVKASEQTKAGTFLFLIEINSQGLIKRSAQAVLVVLPLLTVTIDSTPRVSAVTVDNVQIPFTDLPKQFKWVKGETHTIGVPSQIVEGKTGVRYVFTKWVDGATSLLRTVAASDTTSFKAEFKTQFFLTVRTSIPDGPLPSIGTGWYDNGTQAKISTPNRINISSDRRYDFRGWTGNLTDAKANTTVLTDKPKTVVSSYILQFFVRAATTPENLAEVVNGNAWHDSGATIDFTATKRVKDYSFRFWITGDIRVTGLPASIKIEKPMLITANYILLPKVGISWVNTTASKTEFQGESSYMWLKISNTKDRAGEVRLDVQSNFDGIDVNPKSLVLNFEAGQSFLLGFELKFLKDGTGTIQAKINETAGAPDSISIPLKIFPRQSRDNLRAVGKAISVEVLPILNDLMNPTPEVKALAERILAASNVQPDASTVDKAKAMLKFVNQHYEPSIGANPPNIAKIASDLDLSGGALSTLKISGDGRVAQVFFGGMLRSLGIQVRPVIGTMEMSPTAETPYVTLHSWIEFRVDRDWVFADPTETVLDLASINFPPNIAGLAKDSKLFYELSPRWGGPIAAVTYESKSIDITDRYKLSAYANLEGNVVYTRGDASITVRDDSGKEFAQGVPYAVVWMPIEPQATEIRAMRPQGQVVLLSPSIPISKYPIFVSGPKRSDYTFLTAEVSSVFPIVDSMAGSFLERGVNEHTVQTKRDGRLQVGQVEHVNYADKSSIDVTSNSTITVATSSADVRALRLTLVGREGTAGILNVSVPMNLLIDQLASSPEKIVVLLDNKFASPEINILANRVFISLTYSHSTRNIVVYLKTFEVSFDTRDPLSLRIYDAELTMDGPVTKEIKESSTPVFKPLIPGQYEFTIRYRGEKQVITQTITDRDVFLRINLLRSDTTVAGFAAGIIMAVAIIAIIAQLVLSRVFQRKIISS